MWAPPFTPRLRVFRPRGFSYQASRMSLQSRQGGHMGWFFLQDGGLPSWIETHGDFPRITKNFDGSGSSIILSRTGFPVKISLVIHLSNLNIYSNFNLFLF